MIYLDWAASAPPDAHAIDEAREVSARLYANPSSPHAAGREAGARLARARADIAALLGAEPDEIVFTSGGTESNATVLLSLLARLRLGGSRGLKIVTTAIEHSSVFEQARALEAFGFRCAFVRPDSNGIVAPSAVAEALDEDTALVSVMLVNNETGAIQRVAEIAEVVRERCTRAGRRILLHTDAVQAFAKIPFSPGSLGVDAASLSGHKIGAPRGIGALYVRKETTMEPLALGGGQEKGRRPGTENLPGICALARAADDGLAALPREMEEARKKAERLIEGLLAIPGARLFPEGRADQPDERFSPWIVSVGFPPLPGEVVVRLAESRGFLVSTGSACSSRKKDRTRVLEATGLSPETALCAVRVSTGPATTREEIDGLIDALAREVPPVRAMSRGRAR
ncbi:MAG: cysteine desulfurase family protein [Spirochaetes bacterium]|nr:cysteine desulfurase family protein [Spirochaetota bacterium]